MTPSDMLDRLAEGNVDLSKWEENFLASLREKIEEDRVLSDRELELLTEIYRRETP